METVIFPKSAKDNVLRNVTYEDIITAVQSNEPVITEEVIRNVYNEIVITEEVIRNVYNEIVITEEVIRNVYNEIVITEEVIRNVYNEIVKQNLEDALHTLNEDMDFLLSHLDS